MEGEITTKIISLETDTNTNETNQISLEIIYQTEVIDYVNRIIEFNKNLRKSYTVIWEFCNKLFQNSIETNI